MSVSSDDADSGVMPRMDSSGDMTSLDQSWHGGTGSGGSCSSRARFGADIPARRSDRPAPSSDLPIDIHTSLVLAALGDVIPRLADRRPPSRRVNTAARRTVPIDDRLVSDFTALLLGRNHDAVANYVDTLRRSGVAPSDILVRLIGPAARRLHELWREEHCSLLDETVAQGRLRLLIQSLADPLEAEQGRDHGEDQALVLTLCGDRFSVYAPLQSVLLEASGWNVLRMEAMPVDTAERLLRKGTVRCVSLIMMRGELMPALREALDRIRAATPSNSLYIILGGEGLCDCDPTMLGADALAADALDAVRLARPLRASA